MQDWDLVRYFLAVARTGSTLAASRDLKQSQPTVARRIAALEELLRVSLFERRRTGFQLTEVGEALVAEAAAMEAAAAAFADRAGERGRRVAGTVRFTTNELAGNIVMGRALQEFALIYPDVRVELIITDRLVDIAAGEADVALRGGCRPASGELVYRKLAEADWTVYCSRDYAALHGKPETVAELDRHTVVGGDGPIANLPGLRWLHFVAPNALVRYRSNTLPSLLANVQAGLGVSTLPCAFCDGDPNLLACIPPPPELRAEIFLITHERLRKLPEVRALMDFIASYAAARRWGPSSRH